MVSADGGECAVEVDDVNCRAFICRLLGRVAGLYPILFVAHYSSWDLARRPRPHNICWVNALSTIIYLLVAFGQRFYIFRALSQASKLHQLYPFTWPSFRPF